MPRPTPPSSDRDLLAAAIDRQYVSLRADLTVAAALQALRDADATIGLVFEVADDATVGRRWLGAVTEPDLMRAYIAEPLPEADAASTYTLAAVQLTPAIALHQADIATFEDLLVYPDRESHYLILLDADEQPCGTIEPDYWQALDLPSHPVRHDDLALLLQAATVDRALQEVALEQEREKASLEQSYRLEVERQRALEALFVNIDKSLQISANVEAALQIAVEGLRNLLNCDRVFVYRRKPNADGSSKRILAQAASDDRWQLPPDFFEADDFRDGAWQERTPDGQLLSREDIETDIHTVELLSRDRQFLDAISAKSALVVTIVVNSQHWATIAITDCGGSGDGATSVDLMSSILLAKRLATRIGLELEHFEIFDRLEVELQERWRVEQQVRQLNEELESRVRARTQELETANQQLAKAVAENELLAENARTAEIQMRTFFSAMTEIVVTLDPQLQVLSIAPTNPQLLYGAQTDVIDRTVEMLCELDPSASIGQTIRSVLDTHHAKSIKYALEVDGRERWFQARISPNADADGVTWVAQDITALENSEAARVETETQMSLLLDGVSSYAIFELTIDGTIASWNTGAERIYGYTEAEVLHQPYSLLFDLEARDAGQPEFELDRARTQGRYAAESRRQTRTGRTIWTDVTLSTLYDRDREPRGFAVVMRDITEERQGKKWQRLLERAIDACAHGVIVTDASQFHNPIAYVNSGFEAITGYAEYEAVGRDLQFLHREDADQPELDALCHAIRDGVSCSVTLRSYRRDGSMFWNEMAISPVRNESGSVTNYIAIMTDVTASYESEIELTNLNGKLQTVFDSTCDVAIVSTTPDGTIELANAGARRLLGCLDGANLQGLSFARFFVKIEVQKHYFELEPQVSMRNLPSQFECLTRCSNHHDQDIEPLEWTLKRCDGQTRCVDLEIEPIVGDRQQTLGFVAIVQDVTERASMQVELQQSKMLLAGVLESSIDAIMAFRSIRDPETHEIIDFEWIVANAAANRFISASDASLIGKFFRQECPPTHVMELFDAYVAVAEEGGVLEREIYRTREPRGQWLQLTAVKLGDGLTVTLRDITKTKSIETVLQQTNDELQAKIHVLNSHNRDMLKLGELNEYLQACETVREAYEAVAARMLAFFPGCVGAFYHIQDADRLVRVATWGEPVISKEVALKQDCWALRRSRTHEMKRGDHELFCEHIEAREDADVSLCLPLNAQGTSLGLMHIWAGDREDLQDGECQLAGAVSEQLALSIANLKLRESLEQQSTRDPLTGLFNRRYMEDALDRLLHSAHLHKKHLGLVMIDIDRFKSYNDRYGHAIGDLVLREVAQSVSSVLRQSDIACRYGGEELIAILPDTAAPTIYQRAEQIRQRIADLDLSHAGNALDRVTASLGVASFPECGADRRALMRVADDALYRAKNDGRNCVRLAQAIANCIEKSEASL